jgi:DNA-nicking Smr family endonuclease
VGAFGKKDTPMSRRGGRSGGRDRLITQEEADLWKQATRTLERLKGKMRIGSTAEPAVQGPRPSPRTPAQEVKVERPPSAGQPSRTLPSPRPPPLAEVHRRTARQISSGKITIGARIDLHGWQQREAHSRLRAFLHDAHARGLKTVLVVTGKGKGNPGEHASGPEDRRRGVLRRSVPLWLEQPDLRSIVLGYTQAGVRHGGEGALYVQLRRPARSDE